MVHIDEPHDVKAASGWFADAMKTAAGQVTATARDMEFQCSPESTLDDRLVELRDSARGILLAAAKSCGGGGDATQPETVDTTDDSASAVYHETVHTVNALVDADTTGGAHVRRYESI